MSSRNRELKHVVDGHAVVPLHGDFLVMAYNVDGVLDPVDEHSAELAAWAQCDTLRAAYGRGYAEGRRDEDSSP